MLRQVVLLGSPESGKTTIVKQMQLMHNGGFGVAERASYRSTILRNVVYAAREVVRYMQRAGLECVEEENQVRTVSCFSFLFSKLERFSFTLQDIAGVLLDFELPARGNVTSIPSEIVDAIDQLWRDPACRTIMEEHAGEFCLMDSAP